MYFQPDTTWSALGAKTKEEYLERFLIKGKFHAQVHEDVIKSYETVEYLMAHAYYHYRMYDEALKKLLGIFEMAVKLRCKELGIELETLNAKGKRKKRELYKLIEDYIKKGYPQKVRSKLDWLRELRNMFSHPERHSFGGGTFSQSIVPIINILNQLFLPVSYFTEQVNELEKSNLTLSQIKEPVFIFPYEGNQILVYQPNLYQCLKVNEVWYYFFAFIPVFDNPKKRFLEDSYSLTPVILICTDLKFNANGFSAKEYETQKEIEVLVTKKSESIKKYQEQKTVLENMTFEQKIGFNLSASTAHWMMNDFMYHHCWGTQVNPA